MNLILQLAKSLHHRFYFYRPRSLPALLGQPEFEQAPDAAQVSIHFGQVRYCLQINHGSYRVV
jgi:hypothetical protein